MSKVFYFPALVSILTWALFSMPASQRATTARKHPPSPRFASRAASLYKLTQAGHYLEAIELYRKAAEEATAAGDLESARAFLNNQGACLTATFQYREALKSLLAARALARPANDQRVLSGLNLNISSIYLQLGNLEEARLSLEQSLHALEHSEDQRHRPMVMLQLAYVKAKQHDSSADRLFSEVIDASLQSNDLATAAMAWDYVGFEDRANGRLAPAEVALTESIRIRKLNHIPGIENSLWGMGNLRSDQGDFHTAIALYDAALQALKGGSLISPWEVYCDRGRARLKAGDLPGALSDLRESARLAKNWRVDVVSNDSNQLTLEAGLSGLYSSFVEAANLSYLGKADAALAEDSFEKAEEGRAASLRALVPGIRDWRSKLPAHYWEVLPRLQAAEKEALGGSEAAQSRAIAVRTELAEMEAAAGADSEVGSASAFERTRQALSADSALFSFHLNENNSWLWVVSRGGFSLYRLPARAALTAEAKAFEAAVRDNSPEAARLGEALYGKLFGSVSQELARHPRWLLALDQGLFTLPYAALVTRTSNGGPVYLAQDHVLQITSGALMLKPRTDIPDLSGPFLAVGDPVYNTADPRWDSREARARSDAGPHVEFARLTATGAELDACARAWGGTHTLLKGRDASPEQFWKSASAHPAIIHFATHILEARAERNTGWIALSLGRDAESRFITPKEISAHVVPSRLVVLSGCSSGKAEVRASTGLMGLTRAWIGAGAGAVIATNWPTMDENGPFFVDFYEYLRERPSEGAAGALRHAQERAISEGGWRSRPSYWASYFLVANSSI